ncbi:MAG: hypothetical protein KDD67_03680 [Ignavibacteriae bacterium]|nr:hypothetical protein [Ignavibacteriota bacterium]MCB9215058.1 hypothetical protein [Ignavibacteria bacterium]
MTRQEREQLIERYLSGQMSGTEEETFFLEVAANRELRQELRAYRLVEQALTNESSTLGSTHTALRAHVQHLALISGGEIAAASEALQTTSSSSLAGTAAKGGGSTLFGNGLLSAKVLLGTLIGGALVAGAFMLDPFSSDKVNPTPPPIESFTPPAYNNPMEEETNLKPNEYEGIDRGETISTGEEMRENTNSGSRSLERSSGNTKIADSKQDSLTLPTPETASTSNDSRQKSVSGTIDSAEIHTKINPPKKIK